MTHDLLWIISQFLWHVILCGFLSMMMDFVEQTNDNSFFVWVVNTVICGSREERWLGFGWSVGENIGNSCQFQCDFRSRDEWLNIPLGIWSSINLQDLDEPAIFP